ncbi:phage portal protein [Tuberibacillus calidus]|uniref:phage portal protein n=1 Tax=Tuberibacillus calidus TaxID=340097 RepID=UPI0003FD4340|nr:phage portal protein [Tuberibacillus calidus]
MTILDNIKEGLKQHKIDLVRYQKLYNYYIGKHDILNRVLPDPSKPNNKVVLDYPGIIIDTVIGYFASKPISYISKSKNNQYIADLKDVFYLNDEEDVNAEIVKDYCIFGKCYELTWVDPEGKIRFTQYSPLEMYVKKDNKDNIQYAFRYWDEVIDEKTTITKLEYYDDQAFYYFISKDGGNTFIPDPNRPKTKHYFGEVPVTLYKNNDEEIGDFEKIISLVDSVDKLLSDSSNELEAFVNSYLVIAGRQGTTPEDIEKMKQNGVLLLDKTDDAKFLIKDVDADFQNTFFETVDKLIHTQTATPKLTSEDFSSNLSGVALGYKLFGLETKCQIKERKMSKGLRKRIRLITNILNLKGKNYDPSDITWEFTRNIPQNEAEITDEIIKLKGIVSQETLLSWHPRIQSPSQEIEKVKEEKDDMNLDSIGWQQDNLKSGETA